MQTNRILTGLFLLFSSGLVLAVDEVTVMSLGEGEASPPARIEAISWLQGHWVGEGLNGKAEDVISPAADGQMMGMFRHLKADGSINFYEFYVFAEHEGSLTQRLKHFSLPLTSWEEKDEFVEFPLVAIEDNTVYFDGLSYVLGQDGDLTVVVRIDEGRNAVFRYRRVE
jgi:hypothetical protein